MSLLKSLSMAKYTHFTFYASFCFAKCGWQKNPSYFTAHFSHNKHLQKCFDCHGYRCMSCYRENYCLPTAFIILQLPRSHSTKVISINDSHGTPLLCKLDQVQLHSDVG